MAAFHEFTVHAPGMGDGPLLEPMQTRITRPALEKIHGPIGALKLDEVYQLHRREIDAVALAYIAARPSEPEPFILKPDHF